MAGDDDEVFMTRSVNVTPKTTKQHLIVRSCKSEAEITIIEECTRIRGIVLLKLTTNRDEASRGLSATAWLLVKYCVEKFGNRSRTYASGCQSVMGEA